VNAQLEVNRKIYCISKLRKIFAFLSPGSSCRRYGLCCGTHLPRWIEVEGRVPGQWPED